MRAAVTKLSAVHGPGTDVKKEDWATPKKRTWLRNGKRLTGFY